MIQRGQPFWTGTAGTKLHGGGDPVTPQTLFITARTGFYAVKTRVKGVGPQ